MKLIIIFWMSTILVLLTFSCSKDKDQTGRLIFQGVKSFSSQKSAIVNHVQSSNEASSTHCMHTANLKLFIVEISVSQELVSENIPDDLKWYKIGESNDLLLVENLKFTAEDLPAGNYQSIKITFKNVATRIAVYQSDINNVVEMSGSLNEENCGDESLLTQYFSKNGNHSLVNGKFVLQASNEVVRGFKVKAGETTTVSWKLGGPTSKITDATFDWIDVNGNGVWDCGLDKTDNFNCIVPGPMWSFGVDDGEIDPMIWNAVSDIDGNSYNAVRIGTQIWMRENLKTTRLNDGYALMTREQFEKYLEDNPPAPPPTPLPADPPLMSYPNSDITLVAVYGMLYTNTAVRTGKLCPNGWHVPTDAEWTTLETFLGKNAGGKIKSKDNIWWSPNEGATNETEFTAQPNGGIIKGSETHKYIGYGEYAYWWTSTEGWARMLKYNSNTINKTQFHTTGAAGDDTYLGCRCIQN